MGSIQSYKILEQHSTEIQEAIQSDLTHLVDELVVADLVDVQIRNRIFDDPAIASDAAGNARRLLTVVRGKVRQNPAHFDTFTRVLRESNLEQQIQLARRLEEAQSEFVMSRKSLFRTSLNVKYLNLYSIVLWSQHVWIVAVTWLVIS